MNQQEQLHHYTLRLGDTPLVLAQRLCEWCGHAPELEIDLALSNIGLDLLGQARNFLSYAAQLKGAGCDEDTLAFLRDEREFSNLLLVEQPNNGFDDTLVRQFFMDAYHVPLYEALIHSRDEQLSAIAEKSLKEAVYHLRFSRGWMIRLGDGSEESHQRIQRSVNELWRFTGELFHADDVEITLSEAGIAVDPRTLQAAWVNTINETFTEATLTIPEKNAYRLGGKQGSHTEHLGLLLTQLQFVQRAYPNSQW
ncbi:1,2-phenylacetyl-CoA epoxidase subunit PaaC [Providencia huaxiensis]|uniref:Phenylacetate-CoA oxygenase subunit PaaC n=1 Tax=Providencia huaxiensis TaxID=2027290 RepID=A0A8I2DAX8_9GAMM|nr:MULTISPECIES: 1,2-phenylacetyl-CoA epoxidase subunit PaaC [Providencia]MBN6360237.1 phenylacetate-CoA oxygenase subunit PaaC [Providencia huaxiensis]MBQ0269291.1 phenylacetate-CoA oxygenase subunit PaaC [Providencia huaxiensis]MBQ0533589.1 phenylacetate-CoA oxygenase subunit PaaC [Providencia huaxiensis]MBQ0589084.1 phenylacetate-CoA oxygenase subunit PaaC [Providencia huaxiensis]MCD2526973.1 phenylacetate-CoA oxygenase subunit PaaC [Providencia huaxiensis]